MNLLVRLLSIARTWVRTSPHVHLRQGGVESVGDAVDLFDRFLDDSMTYDLEWDDFISWKHTNHRIEEARGVVGSVEGLLFSKQVADREKYVRVVLDERNRMAAVIGRPMRGPPRRPT